MPKRLFVFALAAAGSLALVLLGLDLTGTGAAPLAPGGALADAVLPADGSAAPLVQVAGEDGGEEVGPGALPPGVAGTRTLAPTEAELHPQELAQGRWVEGRVIFPAGTPPDERAFVVANGLGSNRPEQRVEVLSGGDFRFAFPEGTIRGTLRVEGRYLYLEEQVRVDSRKGGSWFVLEPRLGGRIEGELVLPSGLSAEDLDEAILNLGGTSRTEPVEGLAFAFDAIPPGIGYRVELDAECGYGQLRDLSLEAGRTCEISLEVQPGNAVEGRVLDERGAPVPGVEVGASSEGDNRPSAWRRATTGSDGAYAVRGLPPGDLTVTAEVDGYLPAKRELLAEGEGETIRGVDVVLVRGLEITGHVRWPDGTPASGAVVEVQRTAAAPEESADLFQGMARYPPGQAWFEETHEQTYLASKDGSFVAGGLPDASYRVRARKEREVVRYEIVKSSLTGKEHEVAQRATWRAEPADVPAGTSGLDLVLGPGETVVGFARDDLGRPLEAFEVEALPMNESGTFFPHFGRLRQGTLRRSFKGTGGRFELEGLTSGPWSIAARAAGHFASEGCALRVPGDLGEAIELVVPRAGRIEGRVGLEGGGSLGRTWVRAVDGSGRVTGVWVVDAAGTFRGGVPPGRVRVQAYDNEEFVSASTPVEVRPGETKRVDLVLDRGTELSARVIDASGTQVEVEAVELLDPGGEVTQVGATGRDGTYWLGAVPAGKHRLRARHLGKTFEQEVDAGGVELTVELLVE